MTDRDLAAVGVAGLGSYLVAAIDQRDGAAGALQVVRRAHTDDAGTEYGYVHGRSPGAQSKSRLGSGAHIAARSVRKREAIGQRYCCAANKSFPMQDSAP
jgi:hypothetical protein